MEYKVAIAHYIHTDGKIVASSQVVLPDILLGCVFLGSKLFLTCAFSLFFTWWECLMLNFVLTDVDSCHCSCSWSFFAPIVSTKLSGNKPTCPLSSPFHQPYINYYMFFCIGMDVFLLYVYIAIQFDFIYLSIIKVTLQSKSDPSFFFMYTCGAHKGYTQIHGTYGFTEHRFLEAKECFKWIYDLLFRRKRKRAYTKFVLFCPKVELGILSIVD